MSAVWYMKPGGVPDVGTTRLPGQDAEPTTRRAAIRCGGGGYDLSKGQAVRWRYTEMTFNPENMRIE